MRSTGDHDPGTANEARPAPAGALPGEARDSSPPPPAEGTAHLDHRAAERATDAPPATPPSARAPSRLWRRGLLWAGAVAGLAFGGYALAPTVKTMLNTVSTDDAYVNGYVTLVAPRVPGQVARVLVHDNYRVKKGDLAGPARSRTVPGAGRPQEGGRGQRRGRPQGRDGPGPGHPGAGPAASAGSSRGRSKMSTTQVALLRARVAALRSKEASFDRATRRLAAGPGPRQPRRALPRGLRPAPSRPSGRPKPRSSRPSRKSMRRGSPSASARTPRREELTDVPADLNQTFSGVRAGAVGAGPEHGAGRPPPRLRLPDAPAGPRRVHQARQGGEHRSDRWSGSCPRRLRSGRPRPSSSRPGATSPRPS